MRPTVLALIAASGCGGSSTTAPPTPSGPPATLVATGSSTDDVEVARVALCPTCESRPVWGSCVSAQVASGAPKKEALDQCIAFELMAQEAEKRGLATDPETIRATRTALVSELVANEYEARYQRPMDFGADWNRMVSRNLIRFDHEEVRGSAFVRIPVDKKVSPEHDARARALAEEVAASLSVERGLMPTHMLAIAEKIVAGRSKIDHEIVRPVLNNGALVKPYADALFAIPEVGRTSPAVRTEWGWDVILLDELILAEHPPPDELAARMLPDVKRTYFSAWVNQIASKLGVKIVIETRNLPLLENL